jgi:hypothetical protein
MLPEIPRELALHSGPIASVYLEVSRDRGGAPQQVRARWKALADQLREQGADERPSSQRGEAATRSGPGRRRAGARRRRHRSTAGAVAASRSGSLTQLTQVAPQAGTCWRGEQPEITDGIGALLRFSSRPDRPERGVVKCNEAVTNTARARTMRSLTMSRA